MSSPVHIIARTALDKISQARLESKGSVICTVAVGAAYYSYVRSTGAGLLVRGGLPRAYYVGIGDSDAVCLISSLFSDRHAAYFHASSKSP